MLLLGHALQQRVKVRYIITPFFNDFTTNI